MSSLFAAELSLLGQAVPQRGCQTREDQGICLFRCEDGGSWWPSSLSCSWKDGLQRRRAAVLLSAALLPLLAVLLYLLVHSAPPSALLGAESFLGFPGSCLWQSQGQAPLLAVSACSPASSVRT